MTTEWLIDRLSALLQFPVPLDMTEYICSIGNDRDLEDYLKTLLNFNDVHHRKFLHELIQRRKGKVVQEGYKKSELDVNYISPKQVEKKKKGKNQTEEHQVQESPENTESSSQDKTKKKSKFVNLYSQEGQARDVILLKGRHKCDCQASKHNLVNNCLKCGRIVCEQEGSGPCMFCGNLVCSREEQDFINSGTKQSTQLLQKLMDQKPSGWDEAIEQRNRLLEYDRTSEKRTRVIDDESDYFSSSSVWLSPSEREHITQKEEEIRARRYGSRKDRQITFDIMDGRAVESVPAIDDFYDSNDRALQDISNSLKSSSTRLVQDDSNIDPTMTDMLPKFEEGVVKRQENRQKNKGNKSLQPRVQDKEFLEMVDEGLCLSMHQPWASLLTAGIKQHEGRSWYTAHRGRLWIASTARQPTSEEIQEHESIYKLLKGDELTCPDKYPLKCLLGCVTVTNCLPQEEYRQKFPDGESDSPFVFICEDPQELPIRFPIQGKHKICKTLVTLILLLALLVHTGHIDGANPCNSRSYNNGSIVCVCNTTYCDTIDKVTPLSSGEYLLYLSSKEGLRFNKTSGILTTKMTTNNVECKGTRFKVNTSKTYQKIKGFGGAFTDAAGINILSLSKAAQDSLLRSYYSKDGIEYNLGRVPIAGTDFSTYPYTYDDDGGPDHVLTNFNLTKEDINLKIPIIIRAQQMSEKEIQLVGSAWSAPIYMKTNKKITGLGFLDKKYYSAWADYHIKFLDEYKKYNISFWALTTGNEPINGIIPLATFNSMGWTSWTHREWIGQNLGPKLRDSQHNKTIIIGFDDQLIMLPWWMKLVFQDTKAASYVSGIGIHWYMDFFTPVSVLQSTHNEFPDKFLVYTESCTGFLPWSRGVSLGSWERGEEYMHSIISTINHWVTSWIDWNIALNLQGGPNWVENFVDSPIIVNNLTDEFYKQPLFYALGHFSKFIKQGALRIDIQPQQSVNVEVLAVQNPDKEIVIVFHNMKNQRENVVLEDLNNNTCIEIELPGKSFATLIYWP